VDDVDGRVFLTMELVSGQPLSELIPRGGLPLERLLVIAVPLMEAVSAAHARGITHRDLKRANVMVTADGQVKVLDFGLAKPSDAVSSAGATVTEAPEVITGQGCILGTIAYMSPERRKARWSTRDPTCSHSA
jgi:serine/threonine protein kinase